MSYQNVDAKLDSIISEFSKRVEEMRTQRNESVLSPAHARQILAGTWELDYAAVEIMKILSVTTPNLSVFGERSNQGLWNWNSNFRLRFHHLTVFGSGSNHPKLLGLQPRSPGSNTECANSASFFNCYATVRKQSLTAK